MASVHLKTLPLPPKPTTYEMWRKNWPQYLSAYNVAFSAERHATQQALADPSKEAKDRIIFARVFGYLLIELFNRRAILTDGPCNWLLMELQSEQQGDGDDNNAVFNLGRFYCDHFLRSFRTTTTSYLTPSSPPSFDTMEEMAEHSDGKDDRMAKHKALARDGYRCILTGLFDQASILEDRGLYDMSIQLHAGVTTVAPCCILKEQAVNPTGGNGSGRVIDKTPYTTATISILEYFGLNELVQGLAEDGAHCLRNLLSLDPISRGYFDNLDLWFEYTEEPNHYQVCVALPPHESYLRVYQGHGHLFVTFSDASVSPDPQLLGLQAVCARVAHLSGAAKAFDEEECNLEEEYNLEEACDLGEECDLEDTSFLAVDDPGSSPHQLDHLLTPLVTIPGVA